MATPDAHRPPNQTSDLDGIGDHAGAEVASNGEVQPDRAMPGEQLRRESEQHPASDAQAGTRHTTRRQAAEPTGVTQTKDT